MNATWQAVLITSALYILPLNAIAWLASRFYIQTKLSVFSVTETMYETPVTMKEFYTMLSDYFSAFIFTVCCYAVLALFAFYLISVYVYSAQGTNRPSLMTSVRFLAHKAVKIFLHSLFFIIAIIIIPFLCKLIAAYVYAVGNELLAEHLYEIMFFISQILPVIIVVLISISFWFANEAIIFDNCGIFDSYEYSSSLTGGIYWFRTLITVLPFTALVFLIAQGFSQLLTGTSLLSYLMRIQSMLTKEIPSLIPKTITMFEAKDYMQIQFDHLLPLQISIAVSTIIMLFLIPQFNLLFYTDVKTRKMRDPYYYDFHNDILSKETIESESQLNA